MFGVITTFTFKCSTNHVVDNRLLLGSHRIVNILNSLAVLDVIFDITCVCWIPISMIDFETGVDNGLIFQCDQISISVRQCDVVNQSARIGAGQNQAQFTNETVKNLLGLLCQLIGIDGKRLDVSVLHQRPGILCLIGVIEVPVGVDTVVTILENSMSENVSWFTVTMLPNQRNGRLVLMRKGIFH